MQTRIVIQSRRRRISFKPKQSFRGRSLLRLALNGYTQIQIEKILFPIMNFRFSPSARLAEESLANPNSHSEPLGDESHTRYKSKFAKNLSLSLNTNPISHSVLDTKSVNADFLITLFCREHSPTKINTLV